MSEAVSYLLDTNILVALIRANPLGQYINDKYKLDQNLFRCLVSVVSVGELFALGRAFNWGEKKLHKLKNLLNELVWIHIDSLDILDAYGEIYHASTQSGRPMGENDIWIAATAKVTGTVLLTTDKDFDHLHGKYFTRIWIDPENKTNSKPKERR